VTAMPCTDPFRAESMSYVDVADTDVDCLPDRDISLGVRLASWKRPPGRTRRKWLDQIRSGISLLSPADLWRHIAVRRGHSGLTQRSHQLTMPWRRRLSSSLHDYEQPTNLRLERRHFGRRRRLHFRTECLIEAHQKSAFSSRRTLIKSLALSHAVY